MSDPSLKNRAAIRSLFDDIAAECRWAVDDIRQEVVERPWFGRETTPEMVQGIDMLSESEREAAGPQEPSREDLYGHEPNDPAEHEKEIER